MDPDVDSEYGKVPDKKKVDIWGDPIKNVRRTALSTYNPRHFHETSRLFKDKKIMNFIEKNTTEGRHIIKTQKLKQ